MVVTDEKNSGNLKEIPTDILVAGSYSGFLNNIYILCLGPLGESIHPGRHIFNLSYDLLSGDMVSKQEAPLQLARFSLVIQNAKTKRTVRAAMSE